MVLELGNAHTHTHPRFHKKKTPVQKVQSGNVIPKTPNFFVAVAILKLKIFITFTLLYKHTHTYTQTPMRNGVIVVVLAAVLV